MKLLVCSFGGVASKSFIKGVVSASPQQVPWHHGHYRQPPARVDEDVRVVYLFGNPMNAVVSFFNRRRSKSRLHGFTQADQHPDPQWAQKHCRNLGGDWRALDPTWGLREYLANGKDLFGLEEHFRNWTTARRPYPMGLLKYETLWDNLEPCFRYLGIPDCDLSRFPGRQKRGSDWKSLPPELQEGLLDLYGELHRRIEASEGFRILR